MKLDVFFQEREWERVFEDPRSWLDKVSRGARMVQSYKASIHDNNIMSRTIKGRSENRTLDRSDSQVRSLRFQSIGSILTTLTKTHPMFLSNSHRPRLEETSMECSCPLNPTIFPHGSFFIKKKMDGSNHPSASIRTRKRS